MAVRWYVRFRLSLADVVEWWAEHGIIVDGSTVHRWVRRYHALILSEAHLQRVVRACVAYFNAARPHQGLPQRIPAPPEAYSPGVGTVRATPVLGGRYYIYWRAA